MASGTENRVPLWLDCDPGHDDAFAILLAAHHPELNLLGVSTVHGNASLANTTRNAGSILQAIGRPKVPVYPGAKKPFCREIIHAPDIHGDSGIDGTDLLPTPTFPPRTDVNAIVAMRDALLSWPKDTAWVVATGTLTNVALLFATFPEVAEHVRGVSIMGGAIGDGFADVPISKKEGDEGRIGNTGPFAEFNIYADPEAAQSIMSSPVLAPKTTLITLDLTHQVLGTSEIQSRVLGKELNSAHEATVLRQILHSLLMFFAGTYERIFSIDAGPPLHDPVAVAVLLSNLNSGSSSARPSLRFDDKKGTRYHVKVVTDGTHGADDLVKGHVGHTIATPAPANGGVTIPCGMDVERFWEIVLDCLQRADDVNAAQQA